MGRKERDSWEGKEETKKNKQKRLGRKGLTDGEEGGWLPGGEKRMGFGNEKDPYPKGIVKVSWNVGIQKRKRGRR